MENVGDLNMISQIGGTVGDLTTPAGVVLMSGSLVSSLGYEVRMNSTLD